jgi:hypothetical protein
MAAKNTANTLPILNFHHLSYGRPENVAKNHASFDNRYRTVQEEHIMPRYVHAVMDSADESELACRMLPDWAASQRAQAHS